MRPVTTDRCRYATSRMRRRVHADVAWKLVRQRRQRWKMRSRLRRTAVGEASQAFARGQMATAIAYAPSTSITLRASSARHSRAQPACAQDAPGHAYALCAFLELPPMRAWGSLSRMGGCRRQVVSPWTCGPGYRSHARGRCWDAVHDQRAPFQGQRDNQAATHVGLCCN